MRGSYPERLVSQVIFSSKRHIVKILVARVGCGGPARWRGGSGLRLADVLPIPEDRAFFARFPALFSEVESREAILPILIRSIAVFEQGNFAVESFFADENIVRGERDGDMFRAVLGGESFGGGEFQHINFESLHCVWWFGGLGEIRRDRMAM